MDLTPQVMRVLRDGPFELALATAIDQSGLTLDRLCERLAERGVVVSRATLSYWREGRSRPERARSLDAVSGLEAVLGLPPSSLLMLLGPRRPRGRWIAHPPGTLSRSVLWASAGPILAHLAAPPEGELVTHSVHDLLTLGPGQLARTLRVRLLVEATVDQRSSTSTASSSVLWTPASPSPVTPASAPGWRGSSYGRRCPARTSRRALTWCVRAMWLSVGSTCCTRM